MTDEKHQLGARFRVQAFCNYETFMFGLTYRVSQNFLKRLILEENFAGDVQLF